MLARLLQTVLLMQAACGAIAGLALYYFFGAAAWQIPLLAVLTPCCIGIALCAYTAWQSRSGALTHTWWYALLTEALTVVRINVLRQPWAGVSPGIRERTGEPQRIAVLLVHGHLCNHSIWDDMSAALRAQGHTVLAPDLEPVFGSIDNYATIIDHSIQALCQHTGNTKVAVVCHSMGGLVLRAWLQHSTLRHHVQAIVTLGTPHVGTQLPAWFPTPNSIQMAWNSPWLQQLASHETPAMRSLFRIAIAAQDNIVFPQRAQILDGVTPVVFEGIGHLQLCTSPRVRQWVMEQLAVL